MMRGNSVERIGQEHGVRVAYNRRPEVSAIRPTMVFVMSATKHVRFRLTYDAPRGGVVDEYTLFRSAF
jgi:hypothetical protein